MNKIKELKIDSTLWATPAKLVNLLDFKPEKLSIKSENDKLITIITHQVRYENGGFYLTIDNIQGYLRLSTDEKFTAKIENFSVEKNSTKEKLLG